MLLVNRSEHKNRHSVAGRLTGGISPYAFWPHDRSRCAGQDGNFVVSGIDISLGSSSPGSVFLMPLLAAGDRLDSGDAAVALDQLRSVVVEAAARWSATRLTPKQTTTLANVQFAVADLGGAYLGLADRTVKLIRIDDDAATMGWELVSGQWSVAIRHSSLVIRHSSLVLRHLPAVR